MATKIGVFNAALGLLGITSLASPTDDNEVGRTLRSHWEAASDAAFEAGIWNFATERVELARLSAVPTFGYAYYYQLPADYQRLGFITETGRENDPLLGYKEEKGRIATDAERVFISYVSNLARVAVGNWSQAFADYVSAELANRAAPKIAIDQVDKMPKVLKDAKSNALNIDAVVQPPQFRRPGRFIRAVMRGSRNQEFG